MINPRRGIFLLRGTREWKESTEEEERWALKSNYAFPRVTGAIQEFGLDDDTALTEKLINEGDVACVPGTAFGSPGYLRLSFASSMEELGEALGRIKRVLSA